MQRRTALDGCPKAVSVRGTMLSNSSTAARYRLFGNGFSGCIVDAPCRRLLTITTVEELLVSSKRGLKEHLEGQAAFPNSLLKGFRQIAFSEEQHFAKGDHDVIKGAGRRGVGHASAFSVELVHPKAGHIRGEIGV